MAHNKLHRIRPLKSDASLGMRQRAFRLLYPFWSTHLSGKLHYRRLNKIDNMLKGSLFTAKRVLEVGCANGQDFVRLFKGRQYMQIYGMDLIDYKVEQDNFTFIEGDAERIPFPDKYFDVTISIGVLEHIQPVEKLCRVVTEIVRVSKAYCVVVPSLGTLLEPHVASMFWHLRDHNKKARRANLNYFSDESWMKFEGFSEAAVCSFWYLPGLIKNLAIYGDGENRGTFTTGLGEPLCSDRGED